MEEVLRQKLTEALSPTYLQVDDTSGGCGGKYEVIVVSEQFEGLSLLKRHRLVNAAVAQELKDIHAFSQKTFTPAQWEERQGSK